MPLPPGTPDHLQGRHQSSAGADKNTPRRALLRNVSSRNLQGPKLTPDLLKEVSVPPTPREWHEEDHHRAPITPEPEPMPSTLDQFSQPGKWMSPYSDMQLHRLLSDDNHGEDGHLGDPHSGGWTDRSANDGDWRPDAVPLAPVPVPAAPPPPSRWRPHERRDRDREEQALHHHHSPPSPWRRRRLQSLTARSSAASERAACLCSAQLGRHLVGEEVEDVCGGQLPPTAGPSAATQGVCVVSSVFVVPPVAAVPRLLCLLVRQRQQEAKQRPEDVGAPRQRIAVASVREQAHDDEPLRAACSRADDLGVRA